jgi:integrase
MPRQRKSAKHLPERVYIKSGGYYFVDRLNKWHFLGREFSEAMLKWTKLIDRPQNIVKMNQLFDRYMLEVAPRKAPDTYKQNQIQMKYLRIAFGEMRPEDVKPTDIYEYQSVRAQRAKVAPNREKSLLSHVFSMAIRWGVVEDNPCRNVKRLTEKKRDRYIEDWEFAAVKSVAIPVIRHAMDFAYLTALRRGDILKLTFDDCKEEGIQLQINKTSNKILILWSDTLKSCVNRIREFSASRRGTNLICTRSGTAYSNHGFSAIWKRTIKKALDLQLIKETFRFHDIRRKAATDAERQSGREYARQLLGHQEQSTTAIYISGVERVKPLF